MYDPSCFGEDYAFKTEGKVFLSIDQPRPGNNAFIMLLSFMN